MKYCVTPYKAVPKGIPCRVCNKMARPGQEILWDKFDNVGHIVYHVICVNQLLTETPELIKDGKQNPYVEFWKNQGALT